MALKPKTDEHKSDFLVQVSTVHFIFWHVEPQGLRFFRYRDFRNNRIVHNLLHYSLKWKRKAEEGKR